jgi:hypothetical protein
MKMRTFIKLKTPSKSIKGTFHARYISERERDPGSEEPESRPLFTHDRDGLKYKAADRYLTGGERANARSNEIQHVIIAFNSHDARELQKLEIAPDAYAPAGEHSRCGESAKIELSDESAKVEHSPASHDRWRGEELAAAHRVQIVHDRPYAEAVRRMMRNLEERAGLSDLRYVMAVHRHTDKTHVHLLLRREYTDRETGEKRMLHRLPEAFLNGRDEQGKARGGLLDVALSDALDTMIPRRQRAVRTATSDPPAHTDRQAGDRPRQSEPDDLGHREDKPRFAGPLRRDEAKPKAKTEKSRPRFVTPRAARNDAGQDRAERCDRLPVAATAAESSRATPHRTRPAAASADTEQQPHTALESSPNLQFLKIREPGKPPEAVAYEEELKKIVAARFAQDEQTKTAESLRQPGTPTKSHLTDSPSDAPETREQKKSQPSRGR